MYCLPCVVRGLLVVTLLLGVAAPTLGQAGRMSGQIVDENGDPIAGAHVRAENPMPTRRLVRRRLVTTVGSR